MADEGEVYAALGYAWIPPELREHAGELEAARNGRAAGAARGRRTCAATCTRTPSRPTASQTVEQMAEAALELGLRVPRDHRPLVPASAWAWASTPTTLGAHAEHMREVASELAPRGLVLLAGVEVDIMADGNLDLPDEVLAELDWVVASVHGARGQTARGHRAGWWRPPSTRTSTSSATRPAACSAAARPTTSTSRR